MRLHAQAEEANDDAIRADLEEMLADMSETDRHAIRIALAAKEAEAERERVFPRARLLVPFSYLTRPRRRRKSTRRDSGWTRRTSVWPIFGSFALGLWDSTAPQ